MSLGQKAIEWGIILIVFWIIFGKTVGKVPILRELVDKLKSKKHIPATPQQGEEKMQVWPQNRAMI